MAHVKRFHLNLFLARNKLRAYDLLLRYDFLSFLVITKLKQTQVDVLCTAVETRATNWLLSFMPLYGTAQNSEANFMRAVRPAHMTFAGAVLSGELGVCRKRKLHGELEIFP